MTTLAPPVGSSTATPPTPGAPRFRDNLRSEWTKTRSVRSTLWTVLCAAALGVGLSALISALTSAEYAKGDLREHLVWDPTSISTSGLSIAQLAIGILGIILITSEYSTRAITTNLMAVPRRGMYLASKATITLAVTLIVSTVTAFASFFIGQALISGHAPTTTVGAPHVLRALLGCGLYGAMIGLLGLALGVLLRSAAGAIAVLVAILFVLPGIAAALPSNIEQPIEKFWPTQAGQQITSVIQAAHTLAPWTGFGVLVAFVVAAVAIAYAAFTRRDV